MGEVIPFPVKNARPVPVERRPDTDEAVDLDRMAKIAAMSVLIKELARIGRDLPKESEKEVTLFGERRRVTRDELFEWAYELIDARDPLLVSLGPGGDTRMMRECGRAFRLMSEGSFQSACGDVAAV